MNGLGKSTLSGRAKTKGRSDSAKKIVDMMREGDTLSCIFYNDDAKVVFHDLYVNDKEEILQKLDSVFEGSGRNTNISEALLQADVLLSQYDDALPKRVLFFTDGEPTGNDTERGI